MTMDAWQRNEVTVLWDVRLLPGYAWLGPDRNPMPHIDLFPRLSSIRLWRSE